MRQKVVSGAAVDEPLLIGNQLLPTSWSADGRFIAYMRNASGVPDVWILPLTADRKPFAFVETAPAERTPRLHPTESGSPTNRMRQVAPRYTCGLFPRREGRNIWCRPG